MSKQENQQNLKIMAVGGIAPYGKAKPLLKEAVEMTGKEGKPSVLVVATPKYDQTSHDRGVAGARKLFVDDLGLPTQSLHEFDDMPEAHIVDELLEWADLVYITGGDPQRMMEVWHKYGIDTKLQMRAMGGMVLSGSSAGAIAPFRWGHSDLEHYYTDGEWQYQPVEALGFVNAAVTPHNNEVNNRVRRETAFKRMFKKEAGARGTQIGIGIDNFAGIKIDDGKLELRSTGAGAGATILDARTGKPVSSRLDANQPIELKELGL